MRLLILRSFFGFLKHANFPEIFCTHVSMQENLKDFLWLLTSLLHCMSGMMTVFVNSFCYMGYLKTLTWFSSVHYLSLKTGKVWAKLIFPPWAWLIWFLVAITLKWKEDNRNWQLLVSSKLVNYGFEQNAQHDCYSCNLC